MTGQGASGDKQRRANLRLGWMLLAVVLVFFFGIIIYGLKQ